MDVVGCWLALSACHQARDETIHEINLFSLEWEVGGKVLN